MFGIKIPHIKALDHMLGSVASHIPGGAEAQSKIGKVAKLGLSQVTGQEMVGKASEFSNGALGKLHELEHRGLGGLSQLTSKAGHFQHMLAGHKPGDAAHKVMQRMGVGNPSESLHKIARGKKGMHHTMHAEAHGKNAAHAMMGKVNKLEHGHSMLNNVRHQLRGLI